MARTDAQREAENRARQKFLSKVRELKETTPCADCKQFFPYYVMEFDHVPERGEKKYEMHILIWQCASRKFQEEVKKCDIVCSNCHRARSHMRRTA